jgi:hypothetical protein
VPVAVPAAGRIRLVRAFSLKLVPTFVTVTVW